MALSAYIDVARFLGIDGYALLAGCGIRAQDLDDPEHRLSAAATARLLEKSANKSGCDSFGIRMAECRSFASLGGLSLMLQHLATVREVVDAVTNHRRSLSDALHVALEEDGVTSVVTMDLSPGLTGTQAADLTLGLGYLTLSGASGGKWKPDSVHFAHRKPKDVAVFQRYFQAPLEFDSGFTGFACSRDSLEVGLPLADSAMAANARRILASLPPPAQTYAIRSHVQQSIALLLPSGRANLQRVAVNLDMHERSLQRQLATDGLSFAQVLNEVRQELASKLLLRSDQSMTEIAANLGYAKLSSFTRWFSNEMGTSPSEWRERQTTSPIGPPPIWKIN